MLPIGNFVKTSSCFLFTFINPEKCYNIYEVPGLSYSALLEVGQMDILLLVNGKQAFKEIFDAIDKAKNSIFIKMFIWRNDAIGNALGERILEAARRGVLVHIVKDQVGGMFEYAEEGKDSFFHSTLPLTLRLQSVVLDCSYSMPGEAPRHRQVLCAQARALLDHPNVTIETDMRLYDHSKYYIIDDQVLFLGGMNVEDKEVTADVAGNFYHDFMVKISSGNAIKNLLEAQKSGGTSVCDLQKQKADDPRQFDFFLNAHYQGTRIHILKKALINRLLQAKKSLQIIMAYWGDKDIADCLSGLAKKGVAIRIISPQKANLQDDLNRKSLDDLLNQAGRGIELYLCRDMIHAKLIWIDEEYLILGSANMNKQAMHKLGESNVGFFTDIWGLNAALHTAINTIAHNSVRVEDLQRLKYQKWKAFLEGFLLKRWS
jgi:cardiolipin synthase A/B